MFLSSVNRINYTHLKMKLKYLYHEDTHIYLENLGKMKHRTKSR